MAARGEAESAQAAADAFASEAELVRLSPHTWLLHPLPA